MSNYKIESKAGEYHVWTTSGNWVAWFRTELQAAEFVESADRYEHDPFTMKKAERTGWSDPPEDVQVAYIKFRDSLYNAMVYAERYERAVIGTKPNTEEGVLNIARRSGWASLSASTLRNLYTSIQ